MMIVDAQIHLWSKGIPSAHHRQTPFLQEEALAMMDAAGVDRAVVHPVMWDPDSNELAVEGSCTCWLRIIPKSELGCSRYSSSEKTAPVLYSAQCFRENVLPVLHEQSDTPYATHTWTSRSTCTYQQVVLSKLIRTGKITAERQPNGEFRIDPSE